MAVIRCTRNGTRGFRSDLGGVCYIGTGARARATTKDRENRAARRRPRRS